MSILGTRVLRTEDPRFLSATEVPSFPQRVWQALRAAAAEGPRPS